MDLRYTLGLGLFLPFTLLAQDDLDKRLKDLQGQYDRIQNEEAALLSPIEQANTGRCSGLNPGAPMIVLCSLM